MEYRNIRTGQRLLLRGKLHGAYDAEVVQVDPRRITRAESRGNITGDPVQVKVILHPGESTTLLWVNPSQLMALDF